jgi:alpha-L-arabinofuranosidase
LSAADHPIYTDTLAAGWQDWSWDTTRNGANTQPVHSGNHSYAVDHTAAWGGFYLRAEPALNTAGFTHLRFWLHGGATGGQQIRILLNEDESKMELVTATANTWTQVDLPLADLGNPATLFAIYWQDVNGGAQAVYYLDDISLVSATQPPADVTIQLDDTAVGATIDPRIRGTNMAAWSKPLLTNATFIARTKASGVSVIRIPGGSWSNGYGWLSCEMGAHVANAEKCRAPDRQGGYFDIFWAATPTDWINFLQAVGIEGMYVVNPNGTPQEAAAAVAFFNAAVGDATVIGVDARGKDWLTAGHWAQLRADRGNPEPLGIKLWAVGNEVYAGTQCVENGWEPIWTCEGTEYVNGATVNNIQQGGYRAFRTAMRAVDSTILVGAVGDSPGTSYGNWGNEVVSAAGAVMDFYDVHAYAYWDVPTNNSQILNHPQSFWPGLMTGVQQTFAQHANGRTIPVALTEYNLGLEFKDTNLQMTRAVNGLFMADSVGQLITSGYTMANQFLLTSGDQPETGTDFGLLRPDHGWQRSPQYFGYHLWSKFGDRLLPVTSSANAATELSVYAGRRDANTVTLLVINKQNTAMTAAIDLKSGATMTGGGADVAQATTLDAQTVRFNGMAESNLANDLGNAPATTLAINDATFDYTFAPYSLTLLQLQTAAVAPPVATPTPTTTPTRPGPTPTATMTPIPSPGEPAPGIENCYLPTVLK